MSWVKNIQVFRKITVCKEQAFWIFPFNLQFYNELPDSKVFQLQSAHRTMQNKEQLYF